MVTTLGLAASCRGGATSVSIVLRSTPSDEDASVPSSLVPVRRDQGEATARQEKVLRRVRESSPTQALLAGDSITQSWEGPGQGARTEENAPLEAIHLSNFGDRTERVLSGRHEAPLTRQTPAQVMLLIGTNDLGHGTGTAEETRAAIFEFASRSATQCSDATIQVLAVSPRGERMNPIQGERAQINQAIRALVARESSGTGAAWHRVHAIFDRLRLVGSIRAEVAPDVLHLAPGRDVIRAESMVPELR